MPKTRHIEEFLQVHSDPAPQPENLSAMVSCILETKMILFSLFLFLFYSMGTL